MLYKGGLPENIQSLGMDALHDPALAEAAGPAYTDAYLATAAGLGVVMLIFAAVTGWCFRSNPTSGGADATH